MRIQDFSKQVFRFYKYLLPNFKIRDADFESMWYKTQHRPEAFFMKGLIPCLVSAFYTYLSCQILKWEFGETKHFLKIQNIMLQSTVLVTRYIWPIPRLSLPKNYHEFLKKFPWVNFVVLLAKFLARARFRLFAHTRRDIAVAGRMRCGRIFFGKGDRLSHSDCAGKVFPRRTKDFRSSCKPKRILRLGSNRRPMGICSDPR